MRTRNSPSSRPLRLVFVVATLEAGGSERQMLALAERLPRKQFEASFLLFEETGTLVDRARSGGIEVRVARGTSDRHGPRLLRGATVTPRIARALRDLRPDIVDAWLYASYVSVGLTRFATGVPVFVAGRRSLSNAKGARTTFDHAIGRFACRTADAIVANSEAVRRDAIETDREDPGRITVIRNGVQIPEALDESGRAQIRNRWGVPADGVVVACIANYKAGKGLPDLLEAVSAMVGAQPATPVHLVLIGEGPDRTELVALAAKLGISGRVHLVGHEAEAGLAVRAADIAVHPSHSEGLPNAVLEASAGGLPVIGTAVGGTVEAIIPNKTGILIQPGDGNGLAAAISRLISNEPERKALGEAGRAYVEMTFGMDRMIDEFAALYVRLASR